MSRSLIGLIAGATGETIAMVAASTALAAIAGIPLGVLLVIWDEGGSAARPWLARALGSAINILRSVPFVILMVAVIPLTRSLVGTSIGTAAAIVPLAIAAAPFVARLAEGALRAVDRGAVEAAEAMGATVWQIVTRVLVPEAVPDLARAITVAAVNLVGYSAMAGVIGGGGLGDLAIRYGYQRFRADIMLATVVILVFLVQGLQAVGDRLARALARK